MTLDTGTIATAVFFLLLCTIPFILMNISHRKKVNRYRQLLNREARASKLSITRFNTWGNTAIGMDEKAAVVFFLKKTPDGPLSMQVPLAEIAQCRISNFKRSEMDGSHHYTITEKLDLVLDSKSKKEIPLCFFDIQYDGGMLTGELQMAEKWRDHINAGLRL